jgi:hypothetical protein
MSVTVDGVWIGNWVYCTLTHTHTSRIVPSLIHALCRSLQHVLKYFQSVVSSPVICSVTPSSGGTFPLLWVPDIFPFISYQLLTATVHKDWTSVLLNNSLIDRPTNPLHFTQQYWTELAALHSISYVAPARTTRKTQPFQCCVLVYCRRYLATAAVYRVTT